MSLIICSKCGEKCYDYDQFCPRCGAACSVRKTRDCDGNCSECMYDMPYGCGKPNQTSDASPYPHSIIEKDDKLYYVEDSDRRHKAGIVLFAMLPSGAFGIHDFYGHFYLRGAIHILLFILGIAIPFVGIGLMLLASWVLAIVEAILVMTRVIRNDGRGFPLA